MKASHISTTVTVGLALAALIVTATATAGVQPSDFGRSEDAPFAHRRAGEAMGPRATIVNLDTSESFGSIQDAIDDPDTLAGHTLEVQGADHLEGQVHVTKGVTLRGATGAETIRAAVDTGTAGDDRGWFLVDAGLNFNVQDLGFNGNGHLIFQAFRHKGDGTFTNCRFEDVNYNPSGPEFAGYAIATSGGTVSVNDSTFANIGRVGVLMVQGTSGTVDGCTFTGRGPGPFLEYGYEAGSGANVTFSNNTATDCYGQVPDFHASGILVSTYFGPGTVASLISNTLTGNSHGFSVGQPGDTSDVTARHNRIFGNVIGAESRSPDVDSEDNWWGCNAGPGDPLCDSIDPVDGGALDADPWLVLGLTANPTTVFPGGLAGLTASLRANSDGDDTSAAGFVPDDIEVVFGATQGSMAPATGATSDGEALSTLTAPFQQATVTVSAQVDNQTVQTNVEVVGLPESARVPAVNKLGAAVLILLLFFAGAVILRR